VRSCFCSSFFLPRRDAPSLSASVLLLSLGVACGDVSSDQAIPSGGSGGGAPGSGATGGSETGGASSGGASGGVNAGGSGGQLASDTNSGGDASGGDASGGDASGDAGGSGGTESGPDACSPEARIDAASFNIRFDEGSPSGENAWSNLESPRRQRVISTIEAMAPDVLGVQEALSNQVAELTQALDGYDFVGVGRDDGKQAGEYVGIFYLRARFALLDSGHFWLSDTPEIPGTVFAGSGSIRMATWVLLLDAESGRELLALNTHFDNVSQSSREESARLIRSMMASLAAGKPIVLTGDLNQVESDPAVQLFFEPEPSETQLIDAYRSVHTPRQNDELTYHAYSGDTTGARIDYVLHSSAFVPLAASIRHDAFDNLFPSDHYPVAVTLGWLTDHNGNACP
jgi:endonuclease/exonuclease/phosphatase family metal-dependent hydrolase